MNTLGKHRFLGAIQLGRWVAALAVAGFHAAQAVTAFVGEAPFGLDRILSPGFLGVDFFFVLSGFIIYHAHHGDERTLSALVRFGRKRIARIYLPYLPIALALPVAYTVLPGFSASSRDWSLLKSLTLLPIKGETALPVGWTLVHEVVFYAAFGLLFYGRMLITGSAAWAALIVSYNAMTLQLGPVEDVAFHVLNLEFLLGVAAAHIAKYLPAEAGRASIRIGAIMAAPIVILAPDGPARVAFGLGIAFVILGLAIREREGELQAPRLAKPLGDASYALYLVHVPLLSLTVRAGALAGIGWLTTFLLSLAACCVTALIYHHVVESPVLALVRGHGRTSRRIGVDDGAAPR